jgi:hypothetical protein
LLHLWQLVLDFVLTILREHWVLLGLLILMILVEMKVRIPHELVVVLLIADHSLIIQNI